MSTTTTIQITTPLPLYTRDPFASSTPSFDAPERDLQSLGYTFPSGTTSDSRHDRRISSASLSDTLPPSYTDSHRDALPQYSQSYEPQTIARFLFRFGFFFPPFWILGSLILLMPLASSPPEPSNDDESMVGSWIPEKTQAQQEAYISHIRKAELKWARRSLIALLTLVTVAGIIAGVSIWATST